MPTATGDPVRLLDRLRRRPKRYSDRLTAADKLRIEVRTRRATEQLRTRDEHHPKR